MASEDTRERVARALWEFEEESPLGFGNSPEGGGSWEGGFVCHTRSGKPWLFVFGWFGGVG